MSITEYNMKIYERVAGLSSRLITHKYSTSFSLSIILLHKSIRNPIYSIYGFVRLTDEIVDTFTDYDRYALLKEFMADTDRALKNRISLNPVLHNFQKTVHQYQISDDLIEAFFNSMKMDLVQNQYKREGFDSYIYGSAEVVGLMCLNVFCDGDRKTYRELKSSAARLGSAFQKVNFLRDMNQDMGELNRRYFPQLQDGHLDITAKRKIEKEIEDDFETAYAGIRKLPARARFGVCVAFVYYRYLLQKLKNISPEKILTSRIRVSNSMKFYLLIKTMVRHKLNWM